LSAPSSCEAAPRTPISKLTRESPSRTSFTYQDLPGNGAGIADHWCPARSAKNGKTSPRSLSPPKTRRPVCRRAPILLNRFSIRCAPPTARPVASQRALLRNCRRRRAYLDIPLVATRMHRGTRRVHLALLPPPSQKRVDHNPQILRAAHADTKVPINTIVQWIRLRA
jgi:hypothetical protein